MGARGSGHSTRFSRREQHIDDEDCATGVTFTWRTSYLGVSGTKYHRRRGAMTRGAFPSSSIAITVLIAALAAAGPVQLQTGPNVLQREEYGPSALADLLARYWEERRANSSAKRNLDQIGGGHLVRDTDKQLRHLPEDEHFIENKPNFARERFPLIADRPRNGNIRNSSIEFEILYLMDPTSRQSFRASRIYNLLAIPTGLDASVKRPNDQRFVPQFTDRDMLKNDMRFAKNLDQIGGGHLVRNLDQIGGGNLVRNLDQIGGGNLVRNLDQIGGGHLVRNLDQIGGGHLVRNLDQIGGGNLVRNLDQIGGGNLVRSFE